MFGGQILRDWNSKQMPIKVVDLVQPKPEWLEEFPRKSTRRLPQEFRISKSSVLRILQYEFELFPYKIQILQRQTDGNKAERLAFCRDISLMIENDPDIMNLIFFSNEAHCHLSIKKTCVSGVSVSPMNTPIVNLPSRKGLCDVPYNEMA